MSGKSDAERIAWYARRCVRYMDEVEWLKKRIAELEAQVAVAKEFIENRSYNRNNRKK